MRTYTLGSWVFDTCHILTQITGLLFHQSIPAQNLSLIHFWFDSKIKWNDGHIKKIIFNKVSTVYFNLLKGTLK